METGLKIQKTTFQLRNSGQISDWSFGGPHVQVGASMYINLLYLQCHLAMSDRVEQLKRFIAEDPEDPFNYYALALEYTKIDEGKALGLMSELLQRHKDYVPVYYQLAKLYERFGQKENAIDTFRTGIKVAAQQNDRKTLSELNAALQELLED